MKKYLLGGLFCLSTACSQAGMGYTELAGRDGDGPVTVYYPSGGEGQRVQKGPFALQLDQQGQPVRGNARLVVISHGSGGSPWTYTDLARSLVDDGFVVALPLHRGDNYTDPSSPGPDSWKLRPFEVSRAIDAVAQDPRFAPLLSLDRVGMYGMSAGGHTALSLAGGRWSPARFAQHCEANIAQDFHTCVGLITQLTGGMLASKTKRAIDGSDPIKEHLLITRYNPSRVDQGQMLSLEDIKDILRIKLIGVIPESESVLQASNQGVPAVHMEGTDVAEAYKDVIDRFLGDTEKPLRFIDAEKPGLLKRWFGRK